MDASLDRIISTVQSLPPKQREEVLDFALFLKERLTAPRDLPMVGQEESRTVLVEKDGVLTVKAEPLEDLDVFLNRSREQRIAELADIH